MTDNELKERFIEALKRKRFVTRECSMCSTPLYFFFDSDSNLRFNSNCSCVNYYVEPIYCEIDELDSYLKQEAFIPKLKEFISKSKVETDA